VTQGESRLSVAMPATDSFIKIQVTFVVILLTNGHTIKQSEMKI